MTILILVLVAIGLVVLEDKWAVHAMRSLKAKNGCQSVLVEPGEKVSWSATVENHGRLPVWCRIFRMKFSRKRMNPGAGCFGEKTPSPGPANTV